MIMIEATGPVQKATPLQSATVTQLDIVGAAMEITAKTAAPHNIQCSSCVV